MFRTWVEWSQKEEGEENSDESSKCTCLTILRFTTNDQQGNRKEWSCFNEAEPIDLAAVFRHGKNVSLFGLSFTTSFPWRRSGSFSPWRDKSYALWLTSFGSSAISPCKPMCKVTKSTTNRQSWEPSKSKSNILHNASRTQSGWSYPT